MALSLALIDCPSHYARGTTNPGSLGIWDGGTCTLPPDSSEFVGPTNLRKDLGAGGSTVVCGVRWKVRRPRLTADDIVSFFAGSTEVGKLFRVAADSVFPLTFAGQLGLTTEAGTTYEATVSSPIGENTYAFVVLAMRTIGAGSSYKVLVNDGVRASLTVGSTTLTARTIDSVRINAPRASIRDCYILYGSGAFGADDLWSASGSASYLPAASVGDYNGANWEAWDGSGNLANPVSETQEDSDGTYVVDRTTPSSAAADRVSYKLAALNRRDTVVRGVNPIAAARLSYGSSAGYKICLSQGLTDSKGSEIIETPNYVYGSRPLRFSPFTGGSTLFSTAEIASTDWGVEQTTLA